MVAIWSEQVMRGKVSQRGTAVWECIATCLMQCSILPNCTAKVKRQAHTLVADETETIVKGNIVAFWVILVITSVRHDAAVL